MDGNRNIAFQDSLFSFLPYQRATVRIAVAFFYSVLSIATVTMLLGDVVRIRYLGILLALFLADRLLHIGEGERSLWDLNHERRPSPKSINIAPYLTPQSRFALLRALDAALVLDKPFLPSLLMTLGGLSEVRQILDRLDIDKKEYRKKVRDMLESATQADDAARASKRADAYRALLSVAGMAYLVARKSGEEFIAPRNLFAAAAYSNDPSVSRLMNFFSIDLEDLENVPLFVRFGNQVRFFKTMPFTLGGFAHSTTSPVRHRIMNRAWTARPTPFLDSLSVDLTDLARSHRVGFLIGHGVEYQRIVDVLSRGMKRNALLIGDPGAGKETLVAHLAFSIAKDKVPPEIFDKRVVMLSIGTLVSSATPDEVADRVNKVVTEIVRAGNVILYVPDIHNLAKTSGAGFLSASDILLPVIARGAFQIIGATYPREHAQMIEPNTAFSSAFEPIRVDEITPQEAATLLTYESVILERAHRVTISFKAVKEAVRLAHQYFRQKLLPSSAEELLKEAVASSTQRGDRLIQANDIIAVAERKINVPIHAAGKAEAEQLLGLESKIHERLIDQEQAVRDVSEALREYRSGLARKGGPIASFLFVGPTGVGKTELSKILARLQFGAEDSMVRFDMSEYQEKRSLERFIGSPDGKIAGGLTEAVIAKPYRLILLDEFEKAHPDILNLFLQVFDDGRLTDSLGRVVDFTNVIIIATSNAHSEFIQREIQAGTDLRVLSDTLKKKLIDVFKPELLNRFSSVIMFRPLSLEHIGKIASLQLKDLASSLEENQGISIAFADAALRKIASLGYDPAFGARPLRNAISEHIRSPLAAHILKGDFVRGDAMVIEYEDGKFRFLKKNEAPVSV